MELNIQNENENELQETLVQFAIDHMISVTFLPAEPRVPAFSFKKDRQIIINANWYIPAEIPFTIGHEIGHVMIGEQGVKYFCTYAGLCSEEKDADLYSLKWIYNYAKKRGDHFSDPGIFMQSYGIPWRMTHAVKDIFDHDHDLLY